VWQFCLPLIFFVAAYWKILSVIRRQTQVAADRKRVTDSAKESAPGCSVGKPGDAGTGSGAAIDNSQTNKGTGKEVAKPASRGDRQNKAAPKGLSQAQVNVVTTMVFITVCFVVCWTPLYVSSWIFRLTVHFPSCLVANYGNAVSAHCGSSYNDLLKVTRISWQSRLVINNREMLKSFGGRSYLTKFMQGGHVTWAYDNTVTSPCLIYFCASIF